MRRTTRGPPGWVLLSGALALTVGGMAYYLRVSEDRRYLELAKMNERFERAYVLQAAEDAAAPRRIKATIDTERRIMEDEKGWVVNQSQYYTMRPKSPAFDELDPRIFDPSGGRK